MHTHTCTYYIYIYRERERDLYIIPPTYVSPTRQTSLVARRAVSGRVVRRRWRWRWRWRCGSHDFVAHHVASHRIALHRIT